METRALRCGGTTGTDVSMNSTFLVLHRQDGPVEEAYSDNADIGEPKHYC